MVSVKSILGAFCFIFLAVIALQTISDIMKEKNPITMLIFTGAAILLILLGTYLIKIGEKEDEANKAKKRRERLLKDTDRIRKLK